MEILNKNKSTEQPCKHEVGQVYFGGSEYYLCAKRVGKYFFVNIKTGVASEEYDSMDELDKHNPNDVEVSCHLVID